jgi:hypothetical protein
MKKKKDHNISITKMVRVAIIGGVVPDTVEYPDDANAEAVERTLLNGYGKGILKLNGVGVLSETLLDGDYEYHLTPQPVGKTNIICVLFIVFTLCFVFSLSTIILYYHVLLNFCLILLLLFFRCWLW